jgi:hypothetical protein
MRKERGFATSLDPLIGRSNQEDHIFGRVKCTAVVAGLAWLIAVI